jgi:hypothetical protein
MLSEHVCTMTLDGNSFLLPGRSGTGFHWLESQLYLKFLEVKQPGQEVGPSSSLTTKVKSE